VTDSVTPGDGVHDIDPYLTSGAIRYGAGDWVVPSDQVEFADHEGLTATPLNAFDASHSASSMDVTIDTGEAFVVGSWIGRDTTTTVTLNAQTSNQTVYLGWKKGTSNAAVVGRESAFQTGWPKIAIWQFDTDGSGVVAARDQRAVGEQIDARNEGSAAAADTAGHVTGANVDGQVYSAENADNADNSDALGGEPASDYLRSDRNDSTAGRLGAKAINLRNIEFGNIQNTEGVFAYDNSEGLKYYHNGGWRRVYTSDYKQTSVNGSSILTRDDESGLNVHSADDADNANALGGEPATNYLRSDRSDTISGRLGAEAIRLGDYDFSYHPNDEGLLAYNDLRGVKYYHNGGWRRVYTSDYKQTSVNGSSILTRDDESGLNVHSADDADNANALGGEPATNYLRSDRSDTISGRLGAEAIRLGDYDFSYHPNDEGLLAYNDLRGVKYYHNGGWRRVYTSDYKQTSIGGSDILTRSDESELSVQNSDSLDGIERKKIEGTQSATLPVTELADNELEWVTIRLYNDVFRLLEVNRIGKDGTISDEERFHVRRNNSPNSYSLYRHTSGLKSHGTYNNPLADYAGTDKLRLQIENRTGSPSTFGAQVKFTVY